MQYPFTSDKDRTIDDGVTMVDAPSAGGASAAARRVFAPGDLIAGRYVVVRKLGEGGMGIVYQCRDQVGGVEVAVKGLPPEVGRDADEMEEIRANYQLVSRLHHPNIATARTLERDEATGDYYLVMDLAPGTSLKRWMRGNPQATMEAKLSILRQVSAALDYAHSMKVIHRDVKPENVMVDSEGHAMVLDFGLAAQIRSSQSRTSNAVKSRSGSPGYKSPEQWLGRAQRAPADVYSFGVMAYWMLAGELPFDGDDLVVLGHAVLTAPVEPVAGIPEHMNAALIKALAKKPEDRFSSCGEVVAVLEGRLKAPRGGAKTRGGEPDESSSDGSWGVVGKMVAVAVLFALLAYGVFWLSHRGTDSNKSESGSVVITNAPPMSIRIKTNEVVRVVTNVVERVRDVDRAVTDASPALVVPPTTGQTDSSENEFYTVELGDNLVKIAKREGCSVAELAKLNHIPLNKALNVGQRIKLPKRQRSEAADSQSTPAPTWEETQRAVNEAKRHVLFIRKRVDSVMEASVNPYRAHDRHFGEILAEIDRQYETLKKLKLPTTIEGAKEFTSTAESAAEKIEGEGVGKLKSRLAFCVSEEIKEAKEFFDKSEKGEGAYWDESIAAAARALALDSSNAEAKRIKADAESRLVPTAQIVIMVDGRPLGNGERVKIGNTSWTTPIVWGKGNIEAGKAYGGKVAYERGDKRYLGELRTFTVDWRGPKSMMVAMTEHEVPKHGDTKTITLPGGATMDMIYVGPGEFMMGDDDGEDEEKPAHSVRLTRGFWLGKYEVTQEQWQSVMGENPSYFKGDNMLPVDNVSWEDCQEFMRKVDAAVRRQLDGAARLPTEAEWEYACRAGTRGPYAKPGLESYTLAHPDSMAALESMGWYGDNSGMKTHSVGQKIPNPWGFYDMHGNVWEWCNDRYGSYGGDATDPTGAASGAYRVVRGGGWHNGARNCRSACRAGREPGYRRYNLGFRVCCSAQP